MGIRRVTSGTLCLILLTRVERSLFKSTNLKEPPALLLGVNFEHLQSKLIRLKGAYPASLAFFLGPHGKLLLPWAQPTPKNSTSGASKLAILSKRTGQNEHDGSKKAQWLYGCQDEAF
eukprot:1139395-Pelagomonas_calceolata.AAC.1